MDTSSVQPPRGRRPAWHMAWVPGWAFGATFAALLLGMPAGSALMIGAILVVSGPRVVGPLLRFIRSAGEVSRGLRAEHAMRSDALAGTGERLARERKRQWSATRISAIMGSSGTCRPRRW
jgi:hypothetical protein